MVRLRRVVPPDCARILVKLEWENPTGSMKDRMALAVISRAEADGRLKPGDTVVEYTGGSTGASLALVCAAKGYRIHIVSSDAFSQEKLDQMAALGRGAHARAERGRAHHQEADPRHDRGRARAEPGAAHLLDRPAQQPRQHRRLPPAGRGDLEPDQRPGRRVRALRGHGRVLARRRHGAQAPQAEREVVVVEPAESSVLLGGQPGPHKIEGVGIGYTPPLWEPTLVDEIVPVKTDDAKEMARRLAREEGLFAGTSSGANVVAAIRVAERLGPGPRWSR